MPRSARKRPFEHVSDWPDASGLDAVESPESAAVVAAAHVASTVIALRGELHMSQRALAQAAGVSFRTVQQVEMGQVWPDVETVARIAHALQTPPGRLLGER